MNKNEILSYVDHTLLAQGATWEEIKQICIDGIKYGCASVCIPPSFVKAAKAYTGDKIKICTVIGFPNGYNTTKVKCFEASDAVKNGADEIDMVINIGFLKDKKYDELLNEINEIKSVRRQAFKSDYRNLLVKRRRKNQNVRNSFTIECGFHQNINGIFHGRCNL